jgi:hypothetical protein
MTCGTCTPAAPQSISSTISWCALVRGRTIGVMPLASAAMIISSADSRVMVPCSQSISTQSNPAPAAISTSCGEGIITDMPSAGCPAASFAFIALGRIMLRFAASAAPSPDRPAHRRRAARC